MTVTNSIRIALENHLAGMVGVPAVAWPNVPYTPTPGTPYLRVQFIPVNRRAVVAGPNPEQRHSGLFYVTAYTAESLGSSAGLVLADVIQARFNGSSAIVTSPVIVRIEYSEVKLPLHDPPFYAIPVEIGWYAFRR